LTTAPRRIGAHLPLGGGMVKAVERAVEIGANALQIFSDNPTAWRRRATPPPELPRFKAALRGANIAPLAIHASYLINLAGPEDAFYEQSIELLAHELETGRQYGARYVNVHVGSHRGAGLQAGVERLGTGLARVFERLPSTGRRANGRDRRPLLVLENSAGGGGGIGTTVEELAMVLEAAATSGAPVDRIGFCLDTAHLWSAGYDLRDEKELDRLVGSFDAEIGLGRLRIVHLNDSKSGLASRLDRHEHIGAGRLGSRGMGNVLRHPRLARAAVYLETPGMDEGYDAVNMERARLLLAGRRLPRLPPEALLVRGSRSRRAMPEPTDPAIPEIKA
jgi:deoxyribonuclease-4